MYAQDRIGTHLGHDGKQRCDRGRGVGIGGGQPELHREQGRLEAKHNQQEHRCNTYQRCFFGRDFLQSQRQIGDVQRAGRRIKHTQREQEEGRASQVDHHVLQTCAHPVFATRVDHQAVGGDQQDLEEYKEVKDVAGQKGSYDPHKLELKQRMEVPPTTVPTRGNRM